MKALEVEANLSFFSYCGKKTIFTTGMIVDFTIRNDMFNAGKIEFINKRDCTLGEIGVKANIIFAYGELVKPFLKIGSKYIFGEPSTPYGTCEVVTIL